MKIAAAETKGVQVNGFNKDLLKRLEALDMLYSSLGSLAPKKRLLHVDYKEKGRDMNISLIAYQPAGTGDAQMVADTKRLFEERGCSVSAIIEVDDEFRMIGVHYIRPGFLEECRQDMIKMPQGRG